MSPLETNFRAIDEPQPGSLIGALYAEYAPAYRRWFLREGDQARPDLSSSRRALRNHMPEIASIHDDLCDLVQATDIDARLLTLYRPPPLVRGCSQAVIRDGDHTILVRNYDHAPHLCDAVILRTQWQGVGTIVSTDCLWGALDGINHTGLVVALAFGGDRATGDGFAASLVVRYLLQTCSSVNEAARTLKRLPVSIAYNFALLDAHGRAATVFVGPNRAATISDEMLSTNHQESPTWPAYERFVESCTRAELLRNLLSRERHNLDDIIAHFLAPPLFRTQWSKGSGTLYTAAYQPTAHMARFYWPNITRTYSMGSFEPEEFIVSYRTPAVRK